MIPTSRLIEKIILVLNDLIAVNLAFFSAVYLRYSTGILEEAVPPPAEQLFYASVSLTIMWLVFFVFFGIYRSKFVVSRTDELLSIFKAISLGMMLILLQSFDSSDPLPASRIIALTYAILLFFYLGIGRISIRSYQRIQLKKGLGRRKTLIIGTGKRAHEVYNQIESFPEMGYAVVGFLKYNSQISKNIKEELVLGKLENYEVQCKKLDIEVVLIILDNPSKNKLFEIVDSCENHPLEMKTVPDIYHIAVGNARIHNLFGLQLVDILPENLNLWFSLLKRTVDIIASIFVIFLFLPFWVIIGIMIKFDSKGSVFFKQDRVGMNGNKFLMYKYRSMRVDVDIDPDKNYTINDDPRVTKFGRFMRKTRLDEVPQFINVLEGDMSVIGPRPELPFFVTKYSKTIPLYKKRLKIRPGITGLAQVKQRFQESVKDIGKKLEYDLYYLENMSFKLDIKIFLATIYTVLARRGG